MNIGLIVLFAFGVVRPFSENSRWRDISDKEVIEYLERFKGLIEVLKDDTPRLGSTEKPLAFEQWLDIIDGGLNDPEDREDFVPMMMLVGLMDIIRACRSLVDSEQLRIEGENFHGLYMHGIWVDEADCGESRFWIFPDNCMTALCYRRNGIAWELDTYDFRFRESVNPEYRDTFMMLAPKGNLNYTLSPSRIIDPEDMVTGGYEAHYDESTFEIVRLMIYDESHRFPQWLNWRALERLAPEDERYKEFRTVLNDIYSPQSPHSVIFRNTAPELSDCINNLVGVDNSYLYVYDWQPRRFVVNENQKGSFTYDGEPEDYATLQPLFGLDVSEEHPLYAIPKSVKQKYYNNAELNKLVTVLNDAQNINEVCIIHSERIPEPRLVFPAYGASIALNMEDLSKIGVIKFTRRPF